MERISSHLPSRLQRELLEFSNEQYCAFDVALARAAGLAPDLSDASRSALVRGALLGLLYRDWIEFFDRWRMDEPRGLEPVDRAEVGARLAEDVARRPATRELVFTATLPGQEALYAGLTGRS